MKDVQYSQDSNGFWYWATPTITCDKPFPSQEAAESDYNAWEGMFSAPVQWVPAAMKREPTHHDKPMQGRGKGETFLGKGIE